MSVIEAILLGIIQGLTEFLPVSSSGHLTISKELLGIDSGNLSFEVLVHAATVLSTIVAFRKDISKLILSVFKFQINTETMYIVKILISMIPVFIVGVFFKDFVAEIFGSGLLIVGICLMITALLLLFSDYAKTRNREVSKRDAFIIGIAQAIAVLPGLSRSGATISTGLILGIKKEEVAKFSFLMVLIPILGEAFLDLISGDFSVSASGISAWAYIFGFIAAFISGLFACKVMINIVKRYSLKGFAIYCAAMSVFCVLYHYIG